MKFFKKKKDHSPKLLRKENKATNSLLGWAPQMDEEGPMVGPTRPTAFLM